MVQPVVLRNLLRDIVYRLKLAMSESLDIKELSRASSKIGEFLVVIDAPDIVPYQYKKGNVWVKSRKFECFLVGISGCYCGGIVKGLDPVIEAAKKKFIEGTVWKLSKCICEGASNSASYIGCPIAFQIKLNSSLMELQEQAEIVKRFQGVTAIPPRSVADISNVATNRMMDIIALVKEVTETRETTRGPVANVILIDGSVSPGETNAATIKVGVWGHEKIKFVTQNSTKPLVFFNLSAKRSDDQLQVNHWDDERVRVASDCPKKANLAEKRDDLCSRENTVSLTKEWVSKGTKDVSGPKCLSVAAFLELGAQRPDLQMPDIVQLMWVRIEEPSSDSSVMDKSGSRLWFRTTVRDVTGGTLIGIPSRISLKLAKCDTEKEFQDKHLKNELQFELFYHIRVSRTVTPSTAGASQPGSSQPASSQASTSSEIQHTYVNHVLEDIENVDWNIGTKPNSAYTSFLEMLRSSPVNEEGIAFARMQDIEPCDLYGFDVRVEGRRTKSKVKTVVALLCSSSPSVLTKCGAGYQVTTKGVVDALCAESEAKYEVYGFCELDHVLHYKLDVMRGKKHRMAVVFISKASSTDNGKRFLIEKMELIDSQLEEDCKACFGKLQILSKVHKPAESNKRHQDDEVQGVAKNSRQCRTLKAMPTDTSLKDQVEEDQ